MSEGDSSVRGDRGGNSRDPGERDDVRSRFLGLTRFLLGLQESLELADIFQRCYDGLPSCLGVSRITIMLYDEKLGGLVSDQYLGIEHRGEDIVSSVQPVGAHLSGRCFAEERAIAVDDCSDSDLIPMPDVANLRLKSCMSVPLRTQGRCIGVIRLDYTEEPHTFTPDDIELFSLVADEVGAVIENARLVRQLRATEDELASSVSLLTATLEATADGIIVSDGMGRIVGYNHRFCEMWSIPEDVMDSGDQVRVVDWVIRQLNDPERAFARIHEIYANPELDSHDIIEVRDGRTIERHTRPQRLAGQVVGRVVSFRDVTEHYREARMRLIISRLAVALAATHSLAEVGQIVCSVSTEVWAWDVFYFGVLDSRCRRLREAIGYDTIDGERQLMPSVSTDMSGFRALESLMRRLPRLINRTDDDPGPVLPRFGDASRCSASVMLCPVLAGARVVAAISVQSHAPYGFGEADLVLLQRMADTLGPVIERCWAEERSSAFSSLGQGLSASSSPREAAEVILRVADDLIGWDACYLDLYSAETGTSCSVFSVDTIERRRTVVSPRDRGGCLSPMARVVLDQGAKLVTRGPATGCGFQTDPFGDKQHRSASLMFVPSRIGSRVIGILSIQSYSEQAYDESDLFTLQALADHCSGALERTRIESEHTQLAAAVESSAETVIVTDCNRIIRYVNASFERVTGYSRAEVIGRDARELLCGSQEDDAFYRAIDEALAGGDVWRGTFHDRKKDGTEYQEEATVSPIRGASGQVLGYLTVKRDVTEQRALEDKLRHAQRMEAVGRLAGGIAHDFNNLLQAIIGYSQLLLAEVGPEGPGHVEVTEICKAAERGASLTRQLLAHSRKQVLQPQVVDVNTLIADLERMLQRLIREDIELVTILGPGGGEVFVDPGQLEQVVVNLVVNARDALPQGGRITLRTSRITLERSIISHLEEVKAGSYVVVTVKDNGVGMDQANLDRVFEPFFTTKELGKGTGLGLSTVYGIVKQSGGYIRVQSQPGRGSSFEVFLPAVKVAVPDGSAVRKDRSSDVSGRENLLVVEDEEIIRLLACRILRGQNYHVLSARDGYEALEVAAAADSPIDLLVTDVVMPRMGGAELARRVRDLFPAIRVLFISGHADDSVFPEDSLRGTTMFIPKPFKPHDLTRSVRTILDREKTKAENE